MLQVLRNDGKENRGGFNHEKVLLIFGPLQFSRKVSLKKKTVGLSKWKALKNEIN